jgi:hypothetical protein
VSGWTQGLKLWFRQLPLLVRFLAVGVAGVTVYAVLAYLSKYSPLGLVAFESFLGGLALLTAGEALIVGVCAWLKASLWQWRLAQFVIGGVAVVLPFVHVPAGGYQGRSMFVAYAVFQAGWYAVWLGFMHVRRSG